VKYWWTWETNEKWTKKSDKMKYLQFISNGQIKNEFSFVNEKLKEISGQMGIDLKKIKEGYAIWNEDLYTVFNRENGKIKGRQISSVDLFKRDDWKQGKQADVRKFYLDELEKYQKKFKWNDGQRVVFLSFSFCFLLKSKN